jgi:hypothetical protein
MIHRVATTVERGGRYALGALSITSTRDFFTVAGAIDAAVEELNLVQCRNMIDE